MEYNEGPDDGPDKSSAKVVTGIRMTPNLKDELITESSEAGLSVSEYGEVILMNRHKVSPEAERLAQKVTEQQQEIARLTKLSTDQFQEVEKINAQLATANKQSELARTENEQLLKKIGELNNQLDIYSDERLLYLFENLKGKSDTVENAYGEDFQITYNSPLEILKGIIYNTQLNP